MTKPLLRSILLLSFAKSISASTTTTTNDDCGVYFAESTINNAGNGMFAGASFSKNSRVTYGDIAVPLIELEWHNGFEHWTFIWDDYVWSRNTVQGMAEEIPGQQVHAASPGIGAAINCMLSLINIESTEMKLDNAGLHRSNDPGVGSFTPYHDRESIAISYIQPGEELFIYYGEDYFISRSETYGMLPLEADYERADELLQKYNALRVDNITIKEALWDLVTTKMYGSDSRTINALPKNTLDIPKALRIGTARLPYDGTIRSVDWLKQHGKCMDNIRPGRSTIHQAGRGAFATRFLPKNSIVAPAPLIHIVNKTRLAMYDVLPGHDEGFVSRNTSAIVHQQLLLNYCFGHSESTLLLSPYGVLTSLINHSSKRPNVRIQWASDHWLNMSLRELEKQEHAGLVFDFVALDDIHEGEEVLLDYGTEWQEAWDQHVKQWKPGSKYYRPAYELNDVEVLWPYDEAPYYGSIDVWCRWHYMELCGIEEEEEEFSFLYVRIAKRFQVDGEDMYMVERISEEENEEGVECKVKVLAVAFSVPRDAIVFEDVHYSRDHQLHSSFRHEMMIPNDIFPEAWKNLKT